MSLADLAHLLEEPAWMQRASCRGVDSSMFFPQHPGANKTTNRARQICAGCPVKPECLDWALDFPPTYDHGIYAGTNADQRRVLRRERAA